MANVLNRAGTWRPLLLLAVLLAGAGCEAPQEPDSTELSPQARAALARLPADQRVTAERLLREPPRAERPILVYIDGKRITSFDKSGPYTVINPDLIATAEALVGKAAVERVGPEGEKGVLWITTKAAVAAKAKAESR